MDCHNCGHRIAFSQNFEQARLWGFLFHVGGKKKRAPAKACDKCGCGKPSYLATEKDQPRPKDLRKALERLPEERLWKMMQRQRLGDQGIGRVTDQELEKRWQRKQSLTRP